MKRPQPEKVFDAGLQHERTALSWERTAVAMMVAGVLLTRFAVTTAHTGLGFLGLGQVLFGALLLVWTGVHYDQLHGPLRDGTSPAHPTGARLVGLSTMFFSGAGLLFAGANITGLI